MAITCTKIDKNGDAEVVVLETRAVLAYVKRMRDVDSSWTFQIMMKRGQPRGGEAIYLGPDLAAGVKAVRELMATQGGQ